MKVLLVHPNPLQDYHLERLVSECLADLGHTVDTMRYRECDGNKLERDIASRSAKVALTLVLKGESLEQRHYRAIRSYSALWYVDHPRDDVIPDWLDRGCAAVDLVFVSSGGLADRLRELNPRVHYLVEGAHLPLLQPEQRRHQYDLSFFGTLAAETNNGDRMGSRRSFLAELDQRYDLHLFGEDSDSWGDESDQHQFRNPHPPVWNDGLANAIATSRIVLGYNSTNLVPMYWSNRTYVTLALKGFLMTPYVPGLEQQFANHQDLVWFHSTDELHALIDYYLDQPAQRDAIADSGYRKVIRTWSTRQQIEKLVDHFLDAFPAATTRPKQSILFVTDAGYPGCAGASRQWSALLQQQGIRTDHVLLEAEAPTDLGNDYDVVVMNGYSGHYQPLLAKSLPARKYFAWYSSILQIDLENEITAVTRVKEAEASSLVDGVICSDPNTLVLFGRAVHIPLCVVHSEGKSARSFVVQGKYNISLLGPAKPRKNIVTTLAALQRLSDDYVVHMNLPTDYFEQRVRPLFGENKIVNHGWLAAADYQALVAECDVGIQLSVGESYDYVVSDHLVQGTPVICSSNVPASAHPDLEVRDLESSGELIAAIDRVRRAGKQQRATWFERFHRLNGLRSQQAARRFSRHILPNQGVTRAPAIVPGRPKLSIIYHGRNDNYGGDFAHRLAWSIRSVRKSFAALDPEFIFVNWNTTPGSPMLFDNPLLREHSAGFRVFHVPASIHHELAEAADFDGVYLEWYAKNFGLRRAKGSYLMQMNADNLVLDGISADMLPPPDETLIGARTGVSDAVLGLEPESLSHAALGPLSGRTLRPDLDRPHYVGGCCGELVLSHRDNWFEICGNAETADRWCIDNVTATHLRMVSELSEFPVPVYHIDHPAIDGRWPGFDFPLGYSGPDWGLAKYRLEPMVIGTELTRLE